MARAQSDEDLPNAAVVQVVASVILRAGVAMVIDDEMLKPPARGYMPPPATGSPECEWGAALAVACLIRTFGVDPSQVLAVADSLTA